MKKLFIGIGVAVVAIVIFLTVFFQLYIYHYNKGNDFYDKGNYEKAISEYKKALKCHVPKGKECDIRVNLALSMIAPYDLENLTEITEEEKEELIEVLKEAIDVLVKDGCAHRDDQDGHDKEAQRLKNELQALLDQLLQPPDDGNGGDDQQQQQQQGGGDDDQQQQQQQQQQTQQQQQQQQLQQIMQQSTDEHSQGMQQYDMYNDYDYYDGNCW